MIAAQAKIQAQLAAAKDEPSQANTPAVVENA
jgi:hypothetical protein